MRSPRTTTKSSPGSPQLEKARVQQRRPNTAKNKTKQIYLKKKKKNLGFLPYGTIRQWLWLIHKQLILGETVCSRE